MKKLVISGVLVSLGLFLGRLSGFVREIVIATKLGANESTDLIVIFLTAPDLFVSLLVGGALGMVLIPEYEKFRADATRFYKQIIFVVLMIFMAITFLLMVFSENLLMIMGPGLKGDVISQNATNFAISLYALPLTVLAGVTTSFLHYKQKFFIPALGTLIFNIVIILALLFYIEPDTQNTVRVIAFAILIAALIRWLSQIVDSRTLPFGAGSMSIDMINKQLIKNYFYCLFGGGLIFLYPVLIRAFASFEGNGVLTLVNYSIKLIELPLGVVITVFTIIFFPKLSAIFANKDEERFEQYLRNVFLVVLVLSLAVLIPMYSYSPNFVDLIFGWGALTDVQLAHTSAFLKVIIISLPFQGLNSLLIAACAARRDVFHPLLISLLATVSFIAYIFLLAGDLNEVLWAAVFTYMLISLFLIANLQFVHKQSFFLSKKFLFDVSKVLLVFCVVFKLSGLIFVKNFVSLLVVSVSIGLLFLLVSMFLSKEMLALVLSRKKNV